MKRSPVTRALEYLDSLHVYYPARMSDRDILALADSIRRRSDQPIRPFRYEGTVEGLRKALSI